jgi:glycosyltransferase involved in cell wall biosynthesis
MKKKLSIITINYNNLEGLKKTVESVVNQTWEEFEYIVIDGGSVDGSAEYIESQSKYFDYWVSEPDKGIYNAMNKAIVKATGEYLLFLNSGDHLFNNEVLFNVEDKLNSDISFICGHLCFDKNNKKEIKEHPEKMSFGYLVSRKIAHQSTFIKKTMFDKYGFYNEENKIISDQEFFFKALALNGESYQKLDCIITDYDTTGISAIEIEKSEQERQRFFEKHLPYVFNNEHDIYIFNKFKETNKRFRYLKIIEKYPFFRSIVTLQLSLIVKIIFLFRKK